jgi:hypothetical protein
MPVLLPGPDAPLALQIGAGALLFAHIAGGSVGIAAGYAAVAVRKGEKAHRMAGTAFFVGMLTMTGVAMVTAPFLEAAWTNTTAAIFTMYLVGTAWMAVKRRPGEIGRFERFAVAVPIGIALMALAQAVLTAGTPRAGGFSTVFLFGVLSTLAATCDLAMIRRGGLAGMARVTRHLWRMGVSFFVATGSFFLGQQRVMPESWQGSPILLIPALTPLVLLAYWLAKPYATRLLRRRRALAA